MAKKRSRVPGMSGAVRQRPRRPRDDIYASAAHESGHVIVAHALGRHVQRVRIGTVVLPVGHRDNPRSVPVVSSGFHLAGRLLSDEINNHIETGLPLTADHLEWLRSEIVISLAGRIAEGELTGQRDAAADGATVDHEQAAQIAQMLGKTEDVPGGPMMMIDRAFQIKVEGTARAILVELRENVLSLAAVLADHPQSGFPEDTIQGVLGQLGSPEGSHRHLLSTLAG